MTEDIIAAMKELIRCYEECNTNSKSNQELTYWREKFLSSLPKYDNLEQAAYIWRCFLSIPCGEIHKLGPHTLIKQFEESWKKIYETKPS